MLNLLTHRSTDVRHVAFGLLEASRPSQKDWAIISSKLQEISNLLALLQQTDWGIISTELEKVWKDSQKFLRSHATLIAAQGALQSGNINFPILGEAIRSKNDLAVFRAAHTFLQLKTRAQPALEDIKKALRNTTDPYTQAYLIYTILQIDPNASTLDTPFKARLKHLSTSTENSTPTQTQAWIESTEPFDNFTAALCLPGLVKVDSTLPYDLLTKAAKSPGNFTWYHALSGVGGMKSKEIALLALAPVYLFSLPAAENKNTKWDAMATINRMGAGARNILPLLSQVILAGDEWSRFHALLALIKIGREDKGNRDACVTFLEQQVETPETDVKNVALALISLARMGRYAYNSSSSVIRKLTKGENPFLIACANTTLHFTIEDSARPSSLTLLKSISNGLTQAQR